MIEGQVQTVDRQTQMAVNINVQAVPLDPVITLCPDHKIQWGKLNANGFRKRSMVGRTFATALRCVGSIPQPSQLVIEDSHWGFKEDDPVGIIAWSLNLLQLLDSHFNQRSASIAQDGKAHFELAVGGPLLRGTRGEGQLGFSRYHHKAGYRSVA